MHRKPQSIKYRTSSEKMTERQETVGSFQSAVGCLQLTV